MYENQSAPYICHAKIITMADGRNQLTLIIMKRWDISTSKL